MDGGAMIVARSVAGMAAVTEGRLPGGLPYLRLGQGPPLVMALGGAAEHAGPAGLARRVHRSTAARFAGHFTVYVTGHKPGLAPGATMPGIAADFAKAIEGEFGKPVALCGFSAGGSVALQLAIGYPHLVWRLVLASAACRLSPSGRQLLAEVARLITAGDPRRAAAQVARALASRPMRRPAGALAWLANPWRDNPAGMLITNAAPWPPRARPCWCGATGCSGPCPGLESWRLKTKGDT
jgi:pimeloyl-ACP methyl ester carboxylesterase